MWKTHVGVWEVICETAIKNTSMHTDTHRHAHACTCGSATRWQSGEGWRQLAFILSGLCGSRWVGTGSCA